MVPPLATVVAGVNTTTAATALPETSVDRVIDAKLVIVVCALTKAHFARRRKIV